MLHIEHQLFSTVTISWIRSGPLKACASWQWTRPHSQSPLLSNREAQLEIRRQRQLISGVRGRQELADNCKTWILVLESYKCPLQCLLYENFSFSCPDFKDNQCQVRIL